MRGSWLTKEESKVQAYYVYDEQTGTYLSAGFDESIPTNATTVPPVIRYSETDQRALIKPVWKNGKWVETANDTEKASQQLLMQQSQQITVLQAMVMQQDQNNAKLQATNAQQATQIKQLQQMFMTANQQQVVEKAKEVTA